MKHNNDNDNKYQEQMELETDCADEKREGERGREDE